MWYLEEEAFPKQEIGVSQAVCFLFHYFKLLKKNKLIIFFQNRSREI